MDKVKIGERWVGSGEPTYIIAEIGANFDGSLEQAKLLVDLAKQAGADAAKFQSFLPDKIVARNGFGTRTAFQARWEKPVYEVYQEATFPREWHKEMADYCRKQNIDFFSSPYDAEAVDLLEDIGVPAYKIGSGDITFPALLAHIARKGKPVILGTGASTLGEVEEAVTIIREAGNSNIILLQCVTSYPSSHEAANIRAMITLQETFQVPVGYSDHSPGNVVPLGAVAHGACVIEKHFTMDKTRKGPDHPHAADVPEMTAMVRDIRLMEKALGSPVKRLAPEEEETVVIQRRSLFAGVAIPAGTIITAAMIEPLRPATGIPPKYLDFVIGRTAMADIPEGAPITWDML